MLEIRDSLMLLCLAAAAVPAATAPPGTPPGNDTLDEVVVVGERAGPGLWHVHRGAGNLWILGTVSPLPKDMTWRSAQVEQVLARSNQVVLAKPFQIGIARALWLMITQRDLLMVRGGRKLRDVMPAPLYARFAEQRARLTTDSSKWERYRPLIASAFLEEHAMRKVGLSGRLDLSAEVRTLAHKHDIPIEELKVAGVRDVLDLLKTLPPETENKCVAAALATVESGLPQLAARARAWATGDVEAIAKLEQAPEVDSCMSALMGDAGAMDLMTQVERTWRSELEKHISAGDTTLAVVNMDMLLQHGGLLDALRSDGFDVEAP